MKRRLRKKELLLEVQRERDALDETLALLSPGQMTKAGVTRGGWSVKDVLTHLVEWQQMNLDWYAAGVRGEKPAMPAPGFTLRELPRLNAMIYRKHHRRSLRAVMQDYRSYHERVVALVEAVSDADLVTLGRFSWDRTFLDAERLLAREYGSPLSVGAHAHSAVVARPRASRATANTMMPARRPPERG